VAKLEFLDILVIRDVRGGVAIQVQAYQDIRGKAILDILVIQDKVLIVGIQEQVLIVVIRD